MHRFRFGWDAFHGLDRVHTKSPAFKAVEQLAKRLGVELDLYVYDDSARLALIRVPERLRGQGLAQKMMEAIVAAADAEHLTVTLTPSESFGSSKARLTAFYRGYGFRPNKGRKARHEFTDSMYRDPR